MLTALFAVALANLPPPKGYVESCTVENHGKDRCKSCSAYHSGREDCEALEKQGYTKVCKTRGASVWHEVLCGGPSPQPELKDADKIPEVPASPAPKPIEAPKPESNPAGAPAVAKESRCDSVGVGSFALLPLLLLGVRRR